MCRHLVYLGPPRSLASLLYEPEWSLERQSWQPRQQPPGSLLNADGWGVGWWDLAQRDEPARYRTTTAMWADQRFRSVASLVHATAIVAAVRSATPPLPVVETATAPFAADRWLFSLNGFVTGFAGEIGEGLRHRITPTRAAALGGHTDSEVLFGLVLDRLDAGCSMREALAQVLVVARAAAPGRFNLLLGDGQRAVATTCGASLYALVDAGLAAGGVLVASEPLDDDHAWQPIADGQLVSIEVGTIAIDPLPGAAA